MKLYYFNPNDYGAEFYVMAETRQEALDYVKAYLKWKAHHPDNKRYDFFQKDYERWGDATIENLPNDYTIDEYEMGQVVEGENG